MNCAKCGKGVGKGRKVCYSCHQLHEFKQGVSEERGWHSRQKSKLRNPTFGKWTDRGNQDFRGRINY